MFLYYLILFCYRVSWARLAGFLLVASSFMIAASTLNLGTGFETPDVFIQLSRYLPEGLPLLDVAYDEYYLMYSIKLAGVPFVSTKSDLFLVVMYALPLLIFWLHFVLMGSLLNWRKLRYPEQSS